MSETVQYLVTKEWSGQMLLTAERVVAASSNDPETIAYALGVLVAAWPRLIDSCGRSNSELERATE